MCGFYSFSNIHTFFIACIIIRLPFPRVYYACFLIIFVRSQVTYLDLQRRLFTCHLRQFARNGADLPILLTNNPSYCLQSLHSISLYPTLYWYQYNELPDNFYHTHCAFLIVLSGIRETEKVSFKIIIQRILLYAIECNILMAVQANRNNAFGPFSVLSAHSIVIRTLRTTVCKKLYFFIPIY